MAATHTFSKKEEIANAVTHGIGALLSIAALVLLIVFSSLRGTAWHIVSFTLFGSTMLLLYICSTLVHSFPKGKVKDLFEIFDHSSIYFFIAGTYTPYLFVAVKGWVGWTMFGVLWGMAIGGTVFKSFFVKKFLFTSTAIYIVMGWLVVFIWSPLSQNLNHLSFLYLIIGGICYTIGSIFYMWKLFRFHHAVWHLFVLAGSVMHFFSIIYLLP